MKAINLSKQSHASSSFRLVFSLKRKRILIFHIKISSFLSQLSFYKMGNLKIDQKPFNHKHTQKNPYKLLLLFIFIFTLFSFCLSLFPLFCFYSMPLSDLLLLTFSLAHVLSLSFSLCY